MNLLSMRTNLKAVIFDENFGAFRHICSERIRNTMLFFSESAHKNHEAASSSIIKLACHLKELGTVEARIRRSLYDVTSTIHSTAVIFASLIAGITLAISEGIFKNFSNLDERVKHVHVAILKKFNTLEDKLRS
mgnify:CR=1 FL=1